ncbi:MAG: hypothetical protein QM790_19165 [Nibricoccus sp.]
MAKLESEAAVVNREYPAHYHYFYHRGLALHKLGRDREAIAPLTTYIKYSKDELEYPEAVELLETLKNSSQSTPAMRP